MKKNNQNTQNRFLASILSVFLLTIAFFLSNYGCETELPVIKIKDNYYTNNVISNRYHTNDVIWLYETNVVSNQNYILVYFEVYIIDNGITNFISSNFVSINYIAPIIIDQTFSVDEHSSHGTVIGQIAATPYGSKTIASYAILSGNGDSRFALSTSGELTVNGNLDYESQTSHEIVVSVEDSAGGRSQATITVNLNNVDFALFNTTNVGDEEI